VRPPEALSVVLWVGGVGDLRRPPQRCYGVRVQVTVGAGLLLLFQLARNPKVVWAFGARLPL
jgi:hypothetical protein